MTYRCPLLPDVRSPLRHASTRQQLRRQPVDQARRGCQQAPGDQHCQRQAFLGTRRPPGPARTTASASSTISKDSYFLGGSAAPGRHRSCTSSTRRRKRFASSASDTAKLPRQGSAAQGSRRGHRLGATARHRQGRRSSAITADAPTPPPSAYGEGILVCPTNAGVILGVDLLTHSLRLWAHTYSDYARKLRPRNPIPTAAAASGPCALPGHGGVPGQPNGPIVSDWRRRRLHDHRRRQGLSSLPPTAPNCSLPQPPQRLSGLGAEARDGDIYLGGVYSGNRSSSSARRTYAPSASTMPASCGASTTGMPSGRGVASGNVYYVPLKEAVFSDKEEGPRHLRHRRRARQGHRPDAARRTPATPLPLPPRKCPAT